MYWYRLQRELDYKKSVSEIKIDCVIVNFEIMFAFVVLFIGVETVSPTYIKNIFQHTIMFIITWNSCCLSVVAC
jgi:hypothetical protein